MKQVYEKIVRWIKEKVKSAGLKGCVVGLSGGVDSSLVVGLCAKSVGPRNVLAIIMPCGKQNINDALTVARMFNVKYRVVDLSKVYNEFLAQLPGADKVTRGNLVARLRMCCLYYFANKLKYMVVGTGNKSELSVGYFTKYGDGGVDILPIGDLYKSEVKKLARYVGIPERIINKVPTAGLWKGQTDESELGISYDKLERMLRENKPNRRIKKLIRANEHKLKAPDICPMYSPSSIKRGARGSYSS